MKKIMLIAAVAMAVVSAKAASVDWKVAGSSDVKGYTVYLLTSIDTYESVSALASASVGSAVMSGSRSVSAGATSTAAAITTTSMKEAYFAIVSGDSATTFQYVKTDLSAYVYDSDNQEPSPGSFGDVSYTTLAAGSTGTFGNVPEPTSGLLMLLGIAGLALKRKRA